MSYLPAKLKYRYYVGTQGDFKTFAEAVTWFGTGSNMTNSVELIVDMGTWNITDTISINLPYALNVRGLYFEGTIFSASTGLTNKPMFSITSDVCFSDCTFLGSGLANWGDLTTENFINIVGTHYHEFRGVIMDTCYNAISVTGNARIFVFNAIISNCKGAATIMNSTGSNSLDIEITTLTNCAIGVNLLKSSDGYFIVSQVVFINSLTQTCINYVPADYIYGNHPTITGNTWNNIGTFYSGFDFTRADGRDKNIYVRSNCGKEDKIPHFKVNVLNNTSPTTITTAGTFYKAVFTNGTSYTCKFTLEDNKYTYQPTNATDMSVWISGNVVANGVNRTVDVAIRVNGVATQISTMSTRCATSGQPYPFSIIAYLEDFVAGSYFEIFVTSSTNGDQVTLQDLNLFAKGM